MKILVLGASGFLGTKLMHVLSQEYEIYGTYFSQKKEGLSYLDVSDYNQTKELITNISPDVIIDASGITNVDYCEQHKKETFNVNVIGVQNIIKAIPKKTKLIYISTNYVFDGKKGNYREYDKKNPINYYGTTKSVAEELVKRHKNYLIIRSDVFYGFNSKDDKNNFFKWVYDNLKQNKVIKVVTDQIVNPTVIDDLAHAVEQLLIHNKKGIFHIAGNEVLSRYDIALKIAIAFSFDQNLIKPVETNSLFTITKRPLRADLNIKKLEKCGIKTSNLDKGFITIKEQLSS